MSESLISAINAVRSIPVKKQRAAYSCIKCGCSAIACVAVIDNPSYPHQCRGCGASAVSYWQWQAINRRAK